MNIEQILRNPLTRSYRNNFIFEVNNFLTELKRFYVSALDESKANSTYIQECIFKIQNNYIKCFEFFGEKKFYKAWCLFEEIEIEIKFLLRHYIPIEDEYKILFIKDYTLKFQKLFPYKVFASGEFIKIETRCSICNHKITLRNRCKHKKGEIYMGKSCHHVVTKTDVIGISLVDEPFNKYAVANISNDKDGNVIDNYNYNELIFLFDVLDNPFNKWTYEKYLIWENHSKFNEGRNDKCPCGSSKKYKNCCLLERGVRIEHTQIKLLHPTIKCLNKKATDLKALNIIY